MSSVVPVRSENGSSSGINARSGRQRMAYVLLPHLSQLPRFKLLNPQPSDITKALPPPSLPNVCADSESEVYDNLSAAVSSDDDDARPSSENGSEYAEEDGGPSSNNFLGESVGQKRSRKSDGEENRDEDHTLSGSIKGPTRHPKRTRRVVLTHSSEQDGFSSEDESFADSGSAMPKPKRKASVSHTVAQKKSQQNTRKQWSNPKSGVVIIKDNDDSIKFSFDGHECRHSSGSNGSDSSFTTSRVLSSDFDDSCAALEAFNMCFYIPLNMVFCKTHKKCLPLASLKSHITSSALAPRHTHTLPRIKSAIELLISHLASAFDLSSDQVFHSQGPDMKQLLKPIPFVTEPRLYLQCPLCKVWICESVESGWKSATIRLHLQKNKKCAQQLHVSESERPALKTCFAQRPCGTGGTGLESQIPLVEIVGWRPAVVNSDMPAIQEPQNLIKPTDPSSGEYAKDLKWGEFIPQKTAECIRLLCLLPNPRHNIPTAVEPASHHSRNILERGLYEVHTFLQQYLQEANDFVDSCDPGLRRQLTQGTKSRYNVISISAYADYRHPLMHAVALLLRYKFHHESGQQIPGNFGLPMTKSLNETRIALYEFLLSVPLNDGIDKATLGIRVHALSVSLLTAKCRVNDRIGHIFDVTIPIALYKGNGVYRTANSATQYCAWLQFCLRSVGIQVTRLGGIEKPYIPFKRIVDGMEWSVELSDDGWGDGSDDVGFEDFDDFVLPVGEEIAGKGQEPIFFIDGPEKVNTKSSSKGSPGSPPLIVDGTHFMKEDTLLATLDEIQKWLQWDAQSRDNMSTAFARVKNTWFQIAPYAKIANPALLIEWEQGDQAFTFTDGQDFTPRKLGLSTIIGTARYFLNRVQESLESILPPGYCLSLLNLRNLKDDLSGTPIFEQEANFDLTKPAIDELHRAVLKNDQSYKPRIVQHFLKREQEFLDVLLVAVVLSMGIPPPASQISEICYRASSDGCRGIFLSNGSVLLAMPQRRVNSRQYPALVWALPPQVGNVLLFYISVIRPTAIKLIETVKETPHGDLFTHLFASNHARRTGRRAWSPNRISTTIEKATIQHLQLRLTLSQLYRIMKEIYEHHFPFITISRRLRSHTTTANLQAGHQQLTADLHYGLSQSFPPGISMSNTVFFFRLEKSRIWHGVIGACPSHWSVTEGVMKISSAMHQHNQIAALHRARWLICRFYDFSRTLDRKATRARAAEILQKRPFLKFPVDMANVKFDQVVIEVAAMMQGPKETLPTLVDCQVVSDAISLIVLALEEQASEEDPTPIFDLYDSATASLLQTIKDTVALEVDSFAKNILLWKKLEMEVYRAQT